MKSKIVLIRHGITTGNVQKLYYGKTDLPLSEAGRALCAACDTAAEVCAGNVILHKGVLPL